jgi:hypothetical protein
MDERRIAPFTPIEVVALNEFQRSGIWHAFTCRDEQCRRELFAAEARWICLGCSYMPDGACTWMPDGSWRDDQEILKREALRGLTRIRVRWCDPGVA